MPGKIAAVDRRHIFRIKRPKIVLSYQLLEWPRKRSIFAIVATVASSRRTAS